MEIKKIGVVGAGQMGAGIAQVSAACGLDVWLSDISDELIQKGIDGIGKRLERAVAKGKLGSDEAGAIGARLHKAPDLGDLAQCNFVVEAATERESLKLDIFDRLDKIVPEQAILASNTSSISITRIGAASGRPDRVIGMHFMNPVPVMKLVEIIRGLPTSDETAQTTIALAKRMGKTCTQSKDFPGFIVNRILMPMINEATYTLAEGIGSVEDIDTGMKLGTNQPMGPLALADLIGLDTCLAIMQVLHTGLGDSKYRPCPLLRQYVDAGWLGRKTGRGFYNY
ncbi:MAG TPA: 3-hydroxybutyryl-CoA dehydrogenase [Myxococcota bacterium]|nr:3-hydroxybutyryl-CoA dehydrogenase [Myxococcota bacterium]